MATKLRRVTYVLAVLALFLGIIPNLVRADNPQVQNRFDQMGDSSVSAITNHDIGFTLVSNSSALGSIEFQFCSNDPLTGTPCTAPVGFSVSGATLTSQSGNTGFSISSLTSANDIILSESSAIATPSLTPNTYEFSGVVNPSNVGTFYLRIYTYSSLDASGTATEAGGVALSTALGLSINSYVPPFLEFCVGIVIFAQNCATVDAYIVNMGDLNTTEPSIATSQFLAETNASGGYAVTVFGTTMTSGNNTITSLSSPSPSIVGQNQFGLNLRANYIPTIGSDYFGSANPTISPNYAIVNRFTFNNGDELVSIGKPSLPVTYTASYITNISTTQPAGVYSTTLTFICLANF